MPCRAATLGQIALASVTIVLIVTSMRITCKNPDCPRQGKTFVPKRAGAQFCSGRCRTAAYRKRQAPLPRTRWWDGKEPRFASRGTLNYDGTPALSRGELAERLIEIARGDDDGQPKTGRRFYYLALSHGYIRPDMSDTPEAKRSRDSAYARVTSILGILRKAGRLDWDMVLDLTRDLDQWETFSSPREARAALRLSYDEDRWLGQRYYPILIVEKDTLEPVCKPMASRLQMPFASSRGYGSLKLQHDVAEMLRHRYVRTGQWAIIYFISDLDPSGLDLQRAWQEALESFGVRVIKFVRIGLTREQVDALDNPRLRQGIEVKPSDSRSESYIEEYGERCWETDILPASVIEQALDDHIRSCSTPSCGPGAAPRSSAPARCCEAPWQSPR
jgi:hypothetical protein